MIFFSFLQLYILNIRLKLIVFFEYVGFGLVICMMVGIKKESNLYRLYSFRAFIPLTIYRVNKIIKNKYMGINIHFALLVVHFL